MPRHRDSPQTGVTFIAPCDEQFGLPKAVPVGYRAWLADDVWQPMRDTPIRLRTGRMGVVYYVPSLLVVVDSQNSLERRKAHQRTAQYRAKANARRRARKLQRKA